VKLSGALCQIPKPGFWIVIHPMAVPDYWIQPQTDLDSDGSWKARVYVGQSDGLNNGEHFKILAVANPNTELMEGDILKAWPQAQWRSRIVEVIKKREYVRRTGKQEPTRLLFWLSRPSRHSADPSHAE
jgi:hypothetical protein